MANIHFISNQTRRDNRDISILAIIETIIFVALTWFIAYRYNTYTHIYSSILVAPLLLLKTDFSIDTAIRWFRHEIEIDKDKLILFWIAITLLSFWFSYFIITHFFSTIDEFLKYFLIGLMGVGLVISVLGIVVIEGGLMMGLTVIYTVVGKVVLITVVITIGIKVGIIASIGTILGSILGFCIGAGLGWFIRALVIKFIVTLYGVVKHPTQTLKAIPKNFFEQIAINDVAYSPELLPNIHTKDKFLQVSGLIKNIKYDDNFGKFFTFLLVPIFSLAYLYRWSIKSTAWFYFPLVYIANLQVLKDEENQKIAITHQSHNLLLYFNVAIGILLLLYFGVDAKNIAEKFPSVQIATEIIDKIPFSIATNSIWLVVTSLILYMVAYYFSSLQAHTKERLGEVKYTQYNAIIHWIIRLKFMLWYAFFIWNLVYIANVHWLPDLARYM